MKNVSLSDITRRLENTVEGEFAYFERSSGEIKTATKKAFMKAEGEEYNYSEKDEPTSEEVETARRILDNCDDNYLPLPTYTELNFFGMMKNYALGMEKPDERKRLLKLADERNTDGFAEELEKLGHGNKWLEYRSSELRDIAEDWCEKYKVELG